MIYTKATRYIINPEKTKIFVDYLYILTQKVRKLEKNLSFEYGLESRDKIVLIQRWSTTEDYESFETNEEFKKELATLSKMSHKVIELFDLTITR
ncbi:antibiotic biosynthesis monooxygenase [Mycoplasmopsis bovirhinis]|uniref:Uncharacterized protein n=1 Tax=Mycoplasmopsis bovirhinis TaxID=29553 RepID=A0A2D1JLL0_9BACT|nr:antibiotic biosynthesis monooxygenase [Mycoplasmopsis bovirhinis]ATO30811.1 antibiotic biosynthesis monooxygenase [Mycoplasmopsis bovirhinis]VEU62728.1 Uncharacterised protein [Mycoplasmopsis bovirhinis]